MEVVAKQLHALPSLWLNKEKQAQWFKWMSGEKVLSPDFTISGWKAGWKADWTRIYHIFAGTRTCTQTEITHVYKACEGGYTSAHKHAQTAVFCLNWLICDF